MRITGGEIRQVEKRETEKTGQQKESHHRSARSGFRQPTKCSRFSSILLSNAWTSFATATKSCIWKKETTKVAATKTAAQKTADVGIWREACLRDVQLYLCWWSYHQSPGTGTGDPLLFLCATWSQRAEPRHCGGPYQHPEDDRKRF